jgi:acyl-CoA thioesterase
MDSIIKFIEENDRIKSLFNIEIIQAEMGNVKTKMVVQENMLNAANICHGGALFSFADYTFALISNIYGNIALAISANINFTNPAYLGDTLVATAEELNRTKSTGLYEIKIERENDKKLIAFFTGEVFVKKEKIINT